MSVRWSVIVFLSIIFVTNGWGQTTAQKLSLQDCIHIALENNTTILTNRNLANASGNDYAASYRNILPSVDINYAARRFRSGVSTTQRDVPVFDSTGAVIGFTNQEVRNNPIDRNSYSLSLDVGQTLFDGGASFNRVRQSKATKNASSQSLDVQINQTIRTVAQNYLDLLKQEKLLDVNNLAVQRSQDNLDKTQKMFEIGSVAKVDVFRARVNLGNDRINLITQRNTVKQARQRLNISLGYDPNADIEIDKELTFNYKLPPLEDLLRESFKNQPELQRQEMEIRARELGVNIAKGAFLPTLTGFFSYSRDNTVLDQIYKNINLNWSVVIGVRGTLNLFNGFNDRRNVQNAKIDLKNSRLALEDYKRTLVSDISTIYQRYRDLQEIVEINKENLEASREEYRLANERYRLGSGTSLDLREAQVNLNDAERILVAAEYDQIITFAQLQEALGTIQSSLQNF